MSVEKDKIKDLPSLQSPLFQSPAMLDTDNLKEAKNKTQ